MNNKTLFFSFALIMPVTSYASCFDEDCAARIAIDYSEAVACQLSLTNPENMLQYKSIKVLSNNEVDPEFDMGNFGDLYVVYWQGDFGCSGGSGTVTPNFTVIGNLGGISTPSVVQRFYELPAEANVRYVDDFYKDEVNGRFHIEGVKYGPNDNQNNPTERVHYLMDVSDYKMKLIESY